MPNIEKEVTDLLNVALKFAKWILYKTTTTDKNGKVVRKVSKAYLKHNFMFFVILFARDYKEMKSGC